MTRTPVQSSNIVSIGYDKDTATLEIEFKHNRVYQYKNVPEELHTAMMNSSSHGKFFHSKINNKYKFSEVL